MYVNYVIKFVKLKGIVQKAIALNIAQNVLIINF